MILEAIILSGGFGTRLKSVLNNVPKPMAPIDGKPFLFYLVKHLKQQGIQKIHLSLHHMAESIIQEFENEEGISFFTEDVPLGTGGAILRNLDFIKSENVLILNGDTFNEININQMLNFHVSHENKFTIGAIKVPNASRFGLLELENNRIINFKEKSSEPCEGLINSGLYIANTNFLKEILKTVGKKSFSIEQDFFHHNKELSAFQSSVYFIDIGIPEDYKKAQSEIPKKVLKKALFLDRDGVINYDEGYTYNTTTLKFIEGIFEFVKKYTNMGYVPIIITNQAGIAKNYYSLQDYYKIQNFIEAEFLKHEIVIAKTYFCPYHVDGIIPEFKIDSEDRKPNPGMIFKAQKEFYIDLENSILIGDKNTDIEAGKRAGISKNYLFKGNFKEV